MKFYNSLSRTIEIFKPRIEGEVAMYVCGITPYDTTHMGHAFTYVFFDTLYRLFTFKNYKVIYTQNVTDVDDDLLKRARETKKDWIQLGDFWTERFLKDMDTLHVNRPTHYIKATEAIPEIIEMVTNLVHKKNAYEVGGNVYFSVPSYPTYGGLSHFSEKEMIDLSRERGADPDDLRKKNPLDFILWQRSLPDEPFWDSPFGRGRPGWHIECSCMIRKTLGDQIDIHGGGIDLIYPHHESERAQAESASGKSPFVRYWIHTEPVKYEGEKMSKSLGNLVLVKDLLKEYSADAIRYFLLSQHYRKTWEFTREKLQKADKELNTIKKVYGTLPDGKSNKSFRDAFVSHLENDMDVPSALKLLVSEKETLHKSDVKEMLDLVGIEI